MDDSLLKCPLCKKYPIKNCGYSSCPNTQGNLPIDDSGFFEMFKTEANYFESHWQNNELIEIPAPKLIIAEKFLEPLAKTKTQILLDVGVGDGVHLTALKKQFPNSRLIGLDMSRFAVAISQRRVPTATFFIADAANIPLADNSVDATICYGVLAYLENPFQGISEIVRVTKKGGLIGVWIYPHQRGVLGQLLHFFRLFVPRLSGFFQRRIADLIVPFLFCLPITSNVNLSNSSWKACREIVLVNLSPKFLHILKEQQLTDAFENLNCSFLSQVDRTPGTIWMKKRVLDE